MKLVNVTGLKQNQKLEGREIHSSYNQLFDNMIDGICVVDEASKIQYVNSAYERIFHTYQSLILGQSIFQTSCDDILINAFKRRKSLKGKLNYNHISATASPLWHENTFKGVIVLYREDNYVCEQANNVIELNTVFEKNEIQLNSYFDGIIGNSQNLKKTLFVAQRASKVSSTVLIRGESGTGKELVAKAIHNSSDRKDKAFIMVNCGAIPVNLLESELFGHEQGAFTGAIRKRIGKFEEANGGTLFLDEIGDMPIDLQVKLLRVIQEKQFERVGSNNTISCDVRIIAATNKNLEELLLSGGFREDLYYRINVIPIELPSLKERKEDIPLLCDYFINNLNKNKGHLIDGLSEEVKNAFFNYDWPGNIRELENCLERLSVITENSYIKLGDLPSHISDI